MHPTQSFLIASSDKDLTSLHTLNLLKEREIDTLDTNTQTYEKAMGIEDVRNIQKAILLKPFRGKVKAVILNLYENITLEAQNALLKILEEPPSNTIIILTVAKKELLLPTIISRCKVIVLQEKEIELNENDLSRFSGDLDILLTGKTGDRLKIAQDIAKDKGSLTFWLEKMTIFVKNKMVSENNSLKYLNFLKGIQETYKTIKGTNVNQRTALENLFLSF
jgi:DNA polymerase III delta prime subunit